MIIRGGDTIDWINHTVILWVVYAGTTPLFYIGEPPANNVEQVNWLDLNR